MVNKHFFDSWSANVGFDSSQSKLQVMKEEQKKTIDNASLVETLHNTRLKDA